MNNTHSIADILKKFNPVEDKYISREFQSYGIYLSQQLGDEDHKSLYIKLAKTVHRSILDKSLSFVQDAKAKSKPKLFMWKMKELKTIHGNSSELAQEVKVAKKSIIRKKKSLPKDEPFETQSLF